jgi:hypothetical protein
LPLAEYEPHFLGSRRSPRKSKETGNSWSASERKPGRLTNDDWKIVEGKRDQLVDKIQERYGIARKEVERQLAELEHS